VVIYKIDRRGLGAGGAGDGPKIVY